MSIVMESNRVQKSRIVTLKTEHAIVSLSKCSQCNKYIIQYHLSFVGEDNKF